MTMLPPLRAGVGFASSRASIWSLYTTSTVPLFQILIWNLSIPPHPCFLQRKSHLFLLFFCKLGRHVKYMASVTALHTDPLLNSPSCRKVSGIDLLSHRTDHSLN